MSDTIEIPGKVLSSWNEFEDLSADFLSTPFVKTWGFRGHSDTSHSLAPTILRTLRTGAFPRKVCNLLEKEAVYTFRSQAHLYLQDYLCQTCEDDVDWWGIMQHHGAPTRLLDWTHSPYVAAYFATIGDLEKAGAIWVFSQSAVSDHNKEVLGVKSDLKGVNILGMCEDESIPDLLFSVERKTMTQRMVSQQGFFTFCNNILVDHQTWLYNYFEKVNHRSGFMKFEIPPNLKIEFLRKLHYMNITASSLFHGIDGLGKSVEEKLKIYQYDVNRVQQVLSDHLMREQEKSPKQQ
jgi:hypothetical protein